jgi:hypothetical protein
MLLKEKEYITKSIAIKYNLKSYVLMLSHLKLVLIEFAILNDKNLDGIELIHKINFSKKIILFDKVQIWINETLNIICKILNMFSFDNLQIKLFEEILNNLMIIPLFIHERADRSSLIENININKNNDKVYINYDIIQIKRTKYEITTTKTSNSKELQILTLPNILCSALDVTYSQNYEEFNDLFFQEQTSKDNEIK